MIFMRYYMAFLMLGVNLFYFVFNDYAFTAVSTEGAYLFCYFVGNEPEEQTIHFAASTDGYNFDVLNGNEAVIDQQLSTIIYTQQTSKTSPSRSNFTDGETRLSQRKTTRR